ncbi:Major facilitator superfamily domain,Acetyl-coenzyme A transporter 1 [Cinara cedri]|uniref:Major facilitator superfamily domain,Acetyl-coenzyme A transporter 1 n=1 Tax=Cinara cedri TaxID=506608 RepID=A0A5E4N7A5_9HEMI|nr:Major facilitator superfamily domain,Acetyl-coenzyme A transporter 1 [Cinara cedri]
MPSSIEIYNTPVKKNTKSDISNICILLILYMLQGVPMGFSSAIAIIIQNMHLSSYNDQAKFSFVSWPFSMKVLWAPLVDSLFIKQFGRRKSWLIPVQYSLGIFCIITGSYINEWLINATQPQINNLTCMFLILNFLAATQDIIVDGWALTMLKKENIQYSAMCNSAGQALGIFLSYILLIILISESFWNKWWRTVPLPGGIVTLQGYLYFWGTMFMIITTLVAIFKPEKDNCTKTDDLNIGMVKTYKLLYKIMQLSNIKKLVIILLTIGMSFSSVDATFTLKLIDGGVSKDEIAAIEFIIIGLNICLPFIVIKCISQGKPMNIVLKTMICRLITGIIVTIITYVTPYFIVQTGGLFIIYKVIMVMMYILHQSMIIVMVITILEFFASICDARIGGTNMTLLATVINLGATGSKTGALWLLDFLTFKQCSINPNKLCLYKNDTNVCNSTDETCHVFIDGFYIETFLCTIYGIIWYCAFKKSIITLQSKPIEEWHVAKL